MTQSRALSASHIQCAPQRGKLDLISRLSRLLVLARSRRALAALDDSRLCDLGLTAEQARQEAARPIWDVPSNWRK